MLDRFDIPTLSHACMVDITPQIQEVVSRSAVQQGVCFFSVPHTTTGLTINGGAEAAVQSDMLQELDKVVPWEDGYAHTEGNSAAHIKASLMGAVHFAIVSEGKLLLGKWQKVFLCEFDGPRTRKVRVKVTAG
jgi:secondary thiamine-phosphate synthase enzyme